VSRREKTIYCLLEYGLHCLKILPHKLQYLQRRYLPWFLRMRFYRNLLKLLFLPASGRKRILGVWDYKALPWSVGDPLVFAETLSVLKLERKAEEIDICIVYDRDNPGGNRAAGLGTNLNGENVQDYMTDMLPLFATCPYLGSIFQFSSRSQFHDFLRRHSDRYDVFPPLSHHLGETYNFYGGAEHHEIFDFYRSNGYIPYLRIGNREKAHAYFFYQQHLPETAVPVVLSLKQTLHSPERNAAPAVWLSFLEACESDFPDVGFVVVGLREEIFDALRERSNVIIAKDFGTSVIDDLALIRTSFMYLGTNSGVNTIALFSDTPYLLFQWPRATLRSLGQPIGEQFCFATDKQKIFDDSVVVTPELLLSEFASLYKKLDRNQWLRAAKQAADMKRGHPVTKIAAAATVH